MFNPCRLPRQRLIAASIAAAFSGLPLSALSAPLSYGPNITLDATYSLNGGLTVDGIASNPPSLSPMGADFYLSASAGSSSVFFHTYGDSGSPTYFGARASGEGHFDAYTRANYHGSFTSGAAAPAPFLFSFYVQQGEVGVSGIGDGMAELLLKLQVNTGSGFNTVVQDSTSISQTGGVVSCLDVDFGLATPYMKCDSTTSSTAFGNGGLYTVNLGLINPGQTFAIDYDIIATVSGNGIDLSGSCGGGEGYGDLVGLTSANGDGYGGCATSFAVARSGDPFDGQPDTNPGVFQASIPEPGSLALAALALGGLAAARRRKRGTQL